MFLKLIFCRFLVILARKMKGLGGNFSMKFCFHRENVDFVKIMVFPKENCYFSKLGFPKIDKESWKNWCKMWCEKWWSKSEPQSSKKSVFGAILASPNPRFFEILAIKMKMVFCIIKMSRNGIKPASQIPPRAKALWPRGPGFWSMVEEVAFSNTPVAQGPANFFRKKLLRNKFLNVKTFLSKKCLRKQFLRKKMFT